MRPTASRLLPFAVGAVLTLTIFASVGLRDGIPAFRHDWQWPAYPPLLQSFAASKLSTFDWSGLGRPNVALQVQPYYLILWLAGLCRIPTQLVLALILACAGAVAYCGMFQAVRAFWENRTETYGATLAGIAYSCSPWTVNQLVGGHVESIVAAAWIPWAAYGVLTRRWFLAAAAIALSFLHLQYGLIASVICLLLAMRRRTRSTLAIVLTFLVLLPSLAMMAFARQSAYAHDVAGSITGLVGQSQSFAQALLGTHYFTPYWDAAMAPTHLEFFAWAVPVAIVWALLRNSRQMAGLAVLYVVAAVMLWGTAGPAGSLMVRFADSAPLTLFRETYHLAIVNFFVFGIAIAAGVRGFPLPARLLSLFIGSLVVFAPFWSGTALGQDASLSPSPQGLRAINTLSASTTFSRFYLPPGFAPVGFRTTPFGGADPFAFPVKNSVPLWDYLPSDQAGRLFLALYGTQRERSAAMYEGGVRYILNRPFLEAKTASIATHSPVQIPPLPGALSASAELQEGSPNDAIVTIERAVPARRKQAQLELSDEIRFANDYSGWVQASRLWWYNGVTRSAARAGGFVVMTPQARAAAELHVRCPQRVESVTILFEPLTAQSSLATRIGCSNNPIRIPSELRTPLAIWLDSGMTVARLPDLYYAPAVRRFAGDLLAFTTRSKCVRCVVRLRAGDALHWRLRTKSGLRSPDSYDELGATWRTPELRDRNLELVYAPYRAIRLLEALAVLAWLALIGGSVRESVRAL